MRQFFGSIFTSAHRFTAVFAVMILVLASTALPAQVTPPPGYTLEILNLPATAAAYQMNSSGTVIGIYADIWGGWILENGQFTEVVHPSGEVQLAGINDQGTVFGFYEAVVGGPERVGFSRAANGTITDYIFPAPDVFATRFYSGNNGGDMVGSYETTSSMTREAFLRNKKGQSTDITPPTSVFAEATSINDKGVVTGYFVSALDGTFHGFQYKNGVHTIIDHPDFGVSVFGTDTFRTNNRGDTVGHNYTTPALDEWGSFLRTSHGTFIDISYTDPDPLFLFAQVSDINDTGDILGIAFYIDPASPVGFSLVNYIWRK